MKFSECKNQKFDLEELGGNREVSLEELVNEVICSRRNNFLRLVTSLSTGESSHSRCFDTITFKSFLNDFTESFSDFSYEGEFEFYVIVGEDWTWHLKTTISLVDSSSVFGQFMYHTEILSSPEKEHINSLNGMMMGVDMINNGLQELSVDKIAERMNVNS